MKIRVNKNDLSRTLSLATSILDKKPVIDSLTNIMIKTIENGVVITASNGDLSTQLVVNNVEVEKDGLILVDGKTFTDAISKLSGVITIQKSRNNIKVISDVAEYKLNSMEVDLYPDIDFAVSDNEFEVDGNDFVHALSKVIHSISSTDERPVFSGVNLHSKGNIIEFIATDSYRLSKSQIELEHDVDINVVILANTLRTINKVAKDNVLHISTNSNKVTFRTNSAIFVTRIIDGVYPSVDRLIPTTFNTHVKVNRNQLIQAVDRSSFMKEDNIWILNLDFNHDILKLVTKAQEIGSTYEEVDVDLSGSPIELNLNGKYLIDALNALEDEEVTFNLVGELQALTVSDSTNQTQLLLPIRTASH